MEPQRLRFLGILSLIHGGNQPIPLTIQQRITLYQEVIGRLRRLNFDTAFLEEFPFLNPLMALQVPVGQGEQAIADYLRGLLEQIIWEVPIARVISLYRDVFTQAWCEITGGVLLDESLIMEGDAPAAG